jgi:hypothetical protein
MYTAKACTGAGMTGTCTSPSAITSGGSITGLTAGTAYYVQVTASASTGYLVSPASATAGPTTALEQMNPVTAFAFTSLSTTSMKVTFTAPTNAPGGVSYSGLACTNTAMTQNCASASSASPTNTTFTGLNQFSSYYVQITAAATGFTSSFTVSSTSFNP